MRFCQEVTADFRWYQDFSEGVNSLVEVKERTDMNWIENKTVILNLVA